MTLCGRSRLTGVKALAVDHYSGQLSITCAYRGQKKRPFSGAFFKRTKVMFEHDALTVLAFVHGIGS